MSFISCAFCHKAAASNLLPGGQRCAVLGIFGQVRALHRCHDTFIIDNVCNKGNQGQRAGNVHDGCRQYLHGRNIEVGDHKDDHSHLTYRLGLAPHICGDDDTLVPKSVMRLYFLAI